jgi:PAS domain S-box-containing protein
MIFNDEVIGSFQIRSGKIDAYSESDVDVVKRIADQVAGALANSLSREQIRLQAAALESADNAIIIATPEGIIEWSNSAFTRLRGWTSQEAVGQHTSILKSADPGQQPVDEEIWGTIRQGRPWSGPHINRKNDGTEFPEELTVTPVFGQDGEISHFIGIKQDITERLASEEQAANTIRIESENSELQRLAAARSEFLSTISHELRTPLTTVSAFADILFNSQSENLTSRQREHLGLIRKSSSQLAALINDLLDVSQADSGRLFMNKEHFGVAAMVDEVVDVSHILLTERDQALSLKNAHGSLELHADRSRVIQILTNLLTNASKYSARGSKTKLDVAVEDTRVKFTVIDKGRGISHVDQPMIFSPFFRGSNRESAETAGSGLGLSVVKSLVDLHDGDLAVVSEVGSGTSITVSFPGVVSASQ